MVIFKSVIIFDAETTSLPQKDHNTTKITELAFIGCEVEHLKNSNALPRVLHKLVLLFNPNKLIHPEASMKSGLDNELLMNVKPFRQEDVEVLREFINRLPSPVCIIAHNGDKFDFPILRRALKNVNKELQNDVYCADSLKAFRSLLLKSEKDQCSFWARSSQKGTYNETTPPHQRTQPINYLQHKHVSRELFPDETVLSNQETSTHQKESESKNAQPISQFPKIKSPKSFKLKDIYYFYFQGNFINSHRAEEDSKALLGCIMRCEGFLNWLNEHALVFNKIQPLF